MVAVWVKPPLGASIEDDGAVRLSNGRELSLATIPGVKWDQRRLDKLSEAAQALVDGVQRIADLPDDDPDKFRTAAERTATGPEGAGWQTFDDGKGNIVTRVVKIWFTHDGTRLVPHASNVRNR